MPVIYKICPADDWADAQARGLYLGSPVDLRDGFIHFSDASQVIETAARHYHGQDGLVLIAVPSEALPADALRWEPSRGGALFPHLYAPLPTAAASSTRPLPWDGTRHLFPPDL